MLVREAGHLSLSLHRLPSEGGERFGLNVSEDSTKLQQLLSLLSSAEITISRKNKSVAPNVYEFDQHATTPPPRATYFTLRPKAHCEIGAKFLAAWQIWLELTEQQGSFTIVPRPGKGPRVYDQATYAKLAIVEPTNNTVPAIDWPFPIDLVYTWVDSDDPAWQEQRRQHDPQHGSTPTLVASVNASRWHSRDELRYSLRSTWMYAPFVRQIFIVTNGQVPAWLRLDTPNLTIVTHDELYPDSTDLPTFNSNHIETVLYRIPDLAEHFLYLNDDVFFGMPVRSSDFFTEFGLCRVFPSARHLDERPVSQYDRATVVAHKNTRLVIDERLGVRLSQKFKHTPHAMRRTTWFEIERLFGDALAVTRRNRFRSRSDINGQLLFANYALIKNYAISSTIRYKYLEVLDSDSHALASLHEPNYAVFCLNDSNSAAENVSLNEELIQTFFEERFPLPSPWERAG